MLPEHKHAGYGCPGSRQRESRPVRLAKPYKFWREDAACTDMDSRLFWQPELPDVVIRAIKVCQTCPVIDQCWQWADKDTFFEGVAGGTLWTSRERSTRGR